jgi:8-oxo-dGTP pyrophosphatase MutT (NUDIX family)
MPYIRVIALAIIRRGESLLVFEWTDHATRRRFYRPLGGGVEFGERGHEALVREIREELGADLNHVRYLGALENLFSVDGRSGHQIVLLYEAQFIDPGLYEMEETEAMEDDGSRHRVMWLSLEACRAGRSQLVPEGLLPFLDAQDAVA